MKHLLMTLSLSLAVGYAAAQRSAYPDILDIKTAVTHPRNVAVSFFSDMGAWHAYALPASADAYGGFTGPLLMQMHGSWLSKDVAQLHVKEDGKEIPLDRSDAVMHAFPGLLEQEYRIDSLVITLKLIFVSARKSYLQTAIQNQSTHSRTLQLSWKGEILLRNVRLQKIANGLEIAFERSPQLFYIDYPDTHKVNVDISKDSYTAGINATDIPAGQTFSLTQTHCYYPYGNTTKSDRAAASFDKALQENERRWDEYLYRYFRDLKIQDSIYRRLAVKCIETLITNWRSPAGDLLHGGVFPSASYQGFYGFWSWDSWKQAAALSFFDPELAKENVKTMFDYQDAEGMVPDCIYPDKKENNFRDTKPPLAAWAVLKIYEQTKDTAFVKALYPALLNYHRWWYTNRDHDHNGLCEYGSTDGTRKAAAWESGMDNAVRFDHALMLQNNDHAWSLNQESVDLNCYLYKEKLCLSQLAAVLKRKDEMRRFRKGAAQLRKKINENFYDTESGYYYDRKLGTHQFIYVQGSVGWLPLWQGIAGKKQANEVVRKMIDKRQFNTYVPLPVLSGDNPSFDPVKGYWRGPVWLDQFYFGIQALKRYGYNSEADSLQHKLFTHADGLLGAGPIRENYNPVNGDGLNSKNFSWSAAHILMMLRNSNHDEQK